MIMSKPGIIVNTVQCGRYEAFIESIRGVKKKECYGATGSYAVMLFIVYHEYTNYILRDKTAEPMPWPTVHIE